MKTNIIFLLFISLFILNNAADYSSSFTTYLNTKKSLYVWGYPNADNFLSFVKDHKFEKVFLYVGCIEWDYEKLSIGKLHSAGNLDSKELIQKLIDMGVEVDLAIYLNDSPNNFEGYEKVENVAKALAELQKRLKFHALHFDVEPSSVGNFEKLVKMYEMSRKYLPVSAILKPGWLSKNMADLGEYFSEEYYKKYGKWETFVDVLMEVTDYSELMAYNAKYETVDKFLTKFEAIRQRHPDHVAKPVLELDKAAGNDSLYGAFVEDSAKFFKYLAQVSKDFDGVTIHQYQIWNYNLYCVNPKKDTTYYFGEPKKC